MVILWIYFSDDLRAIKPDSSELDELAQLCNIGITQKIKLRKALKSLSQSSYSPIIIDKEETEAIIQMTNKLKSMENAIKLVADTQKSSEISIIYNYIQNSNMYNSILVLTLYALSLIPQKSTMKCNNMRLK